MVVGGVVIAGISSGSGKTTVATGLMAALARRMRVAPFKVGPDYIDPSYHGLATGRVGRNLDAVMCGEELIGKLYAHGSRDADIAVVEGVMGLSDGRNVACPDELCPPGSSAHIASILGLPVILVLDVRGMGQTAGALVKGCALATPGVRIAGVILNKVGTSVHQAMCTRAIEAQGIPVVGSIPRIPDTEVPSRHLGLITAAEHGDEARAAVAAMADVVEQHCDLEQIVSLAATTCTAEPFDPGFSRYQEQHSKDIVPRIAMAGGKTFTFAYAEHAEILRACGAEVITFDPLTENLPDCEALIIPGGFPELYAEQLSARADLRQQIRDLHTRGGLIYGECAGLLFLVNTLDGHDMVGLIPTAAAMTQRVRLGYREAVAISDSVLCDNGQRVVGHEFHHTRIADEELENFQPAWGWKDFHGTPTREGFVAGNLHASYLHLHPAAMVASWARFVDRARALAGEK